MVLQYAAHNTKHIQLAVRSDLSCFLFFAIPIVKASRKLRRTRRREKAYNSQRGRTHISHPLPISKRKNPFQHPLDPAPPLPRRTPLPLPPGPTLPSFHLFCLAKFPESLLQLLFLRPSLPAFLVFFRGAGEGFVTATSLAAVRGVSSGEFGALAGLRLV